MIFCQNRWQIARRISPEADRNLHEFHPVIRQILYNRGYATPESAHSYLEARQPPGTGPFNMLGISEAVDRLESAIHNQEKIAVYGDYDADGVTATALLFQVLSGLGARVREYIPNRFEEGYGLNIEALDTLHEEGIRLVVTVDCGIRSFDEAKHARNIGLDLIISDHHHIPGELPTAIAIINPKQPGDPYPEKDLAGVGLAYKLASALIVERQKRGIRVPEELKDENLLDLVALGTVADLVPLEGENRALVRAGLRTIKAMRRQGIASLIAAAGLNPQTISSSHISFVLGPRLNAAGRLDSALAAFELLTTHEAQRAGFLAQQLDNQNRERQQITRQIQEQAEQIALAEAPDGCLLFAVHPDFNPGVVGLAASRLAELYYRPAVVAHQGEEHTRGSCRSIPEFHITDALDRCADLLMRHGGHAAAAGFTVSNENLAQLIERLQMIAAEQLTGLDLRPTRQADAEVFFVDLEPALLDVLDELQPTGYSNPQAVFVTRDVNIRNFKAVGKEGDHLKMVVSDGKFTYDAIAFGQGHWVENWRDNVPPPMDLLYTFERNEFNQRFPYQLNVRDMKPTGSPD